MCTAASGRLLVVASHDGQRGRLELREGPGRAVLAARDLDPALGEPAYLSARGGTLAVGCRLRRPGQRETATLAVFDLEPGSGGGRGGLSPRWRVQHEGTCFSVTVTPDERLICVGWDKGRHEGVLAVYPAGGPGPGERPLQVLDLAELRSGGAPGQPFYELAFLSADVRPTDRRSGRICAAAHPDGTYTLWFQDQRFEPLGRDRYLHPGHSVEAIVALAGPILLSGGGDGRLVVHDLNSDPNSGQEWLAGESGRVACLARAGRAGVLAAGCEDGRVWLLTDSGRLVRRLEAPVDSAIESLCLDRRGRWLAATTLDRQLLAWDADVSHAPGERRACLSRAGVWSFLPQELAGGWSMSLHQVTLGSNGLETGRPRFERRLLTPRVPQIEVVALASSEQGWVAGAFSKDLIEGERRPNGWLAVFDPTGRERWSWPPAGRADDAGSSSGASWIASLAIDPAQEWLAAGAYAPDGEQELRLLPLANADPALLRNPPRLSWHTGTVHAVDFHPSGSLLASGAADATLALWEREAFPAPAAAAGAVVAPSLEFEVVAGRLLSDAQRRRAQGGGRDLDRTRGVTALDFSPDGEWLAAGCADGRVRVWKVDALRAGRIEPAYELAAHGLAVLGVAFCPPQALEGSASPRCLRLVTGSLDRRVCVWDFRRQRQLRQLELGEPVQALAVSHLAPARAAVSGRAGTWLVELDPSPGR